MVKLPHSLFEQLAIVLSILTIIAYWTRFFAIPPLIFYITLMIILIYTINYFWKQEKIIDKKNSKLNSLAMLPPLFVALLFSIQMLFFRYVGSNDALHSVLVNIIQSTEKIPQTYAPYSEVAFGYAVGFHSLASYFLFTNAYLINWLFGLIFVFLITGLLIKLLTYFVDKKIAIIVGLLVLGTKMIFLEFFYGMYPRLFAIVLLLASIILIKEKKKLWFLPFSTILLVHPLYGIIGFIWVAVELIKSKQWKLFIWTLPIPIIIIPALIQAYPVYFMNFFISKSTILEKLTPPSAFIQINALVLLFGGAIFIIWFLLSSNFLLKIPKTKSKDALFYTLFFIFLFIAAYLSTKLFSSMYSAFISIGTYILLISIALLIQVNKNKLYKLTNKFPKNISKIIPIAIVLMIIISNIGLSSDIQKRMLGSKISPEMAEFAFKFKDFDPNLEKTFFLTDSSGKIAEYSNKNPVDTLDSFFLPLMNSFGNEKPFNNESLKIVYARNTKEVCKTSEIIEDFNTYNSKYVVVDTSKYMCRFKWPIVFTHKDYIVYEVN